MNALDSRIRELVAYARERDGEDRTTLFRNLVDLFLTGKAPTKDPTRTQLLDVLEALVPHVEADSRRTVADLVASMSAPPLDLAIRLCRDRASLVANLLKAAAFDEDDILDLIERTGREHHQILASREDLSANVWIALARAAPNAPPFDNQSTLALWSDDLGITQTKQVVNGTGPAATVTTLRADKPIQADAAGIKARAIGKPSIRIIKTDEDLMAERTSESDASPEQTQMAPASAQASELRPASTAATQNAQQTDEALKEELDPALQQFMGRTEQKQPLKDPGPGGWAWRSDRDGLISEISPKGQELLGSGLENTGTTVLDILGLNHKLGHPVARAFQRRSTIHDAPIFLISLEPSQQRWTLEATPFFSSCGGIFEGYEGILTPVSASKEEEDQLLPSEEEASAIFLDEVTQPADKPVQSALARAPEPERAPKASKPEPSGPKDKQFSEVASSALQDVISETLKPLTEALEKEARGEKTAPKATAPANNAATPSTVAASPKNTPTAINSAEALSALDLLEEALARLAVAGKSGGDIQVRLQSEIAAACARTLRDILSK